MKDYDKGILQPGESVEHNGVGDFIQNIGTGSIKVVAKNLNKAVKQFSTVIGAGGWRSPESEYDHWVITNNSTVALPVSVMIGKGEAGESKVQINADVNALTRPDNLTKDGNRYFGGNDIPAGGADNYGQIGIYNPVGSGVDVFIDVLRLCNYGSPLAFRKFDSTDLASFFTNSFTSNKNIAGAVGNARFYYQWFTSIRIGSEISVSISTDTYGTATPLDFNNSPIKLSEGVGINFIGDTNKQMTVFGELYEEAI